MALFRPSFQVFRGVGEALGLLEADSATTEYEAGPVRPRLDVQASIESGAVLYSKFVFSRTDIAGGAVTTHDIRPHVLADWNEIASRRTTFVAVAGSEVPPTHDAWVIEASMFVTTAAFTDAIIFRNLNTVVSGSGNSLLAFADTPTAGGGMMVRNATNDPIIISPLPWWIPPLVQQTSDLSLQTTIRTTGVITTNVVLGVLSAPQGVFRRLY